MRPPRFRLRSLILAIVLIALVLGVVAHIREDRRLYRELAAERQRAKAALMRAEYARMLAEVGTRRVEADLEKEHALRLQAEAPSNGSASSR